MTHFVDRRLNPKGKSLGNRQRFLRRARTQIREAVQKSLKDSNVADLDKNRKVRISSKDTREPRFRLDPKAGGEHDFVLPGNKEFMPGDKIKKPPSGQNGQSGKQASDSGEGDDDFEFTMTQDEILDIFFEDLELPNLVRTTLKETPSKVWKRAGITTAGSPTQINLVRTMRNAQGRRLALHRPKLKDVEALEAELEALEREEPLAEDARAKIVALKEQIAKATSKRKWVGFIDPVDVRFNSFSEQPVPTSKAVMFCLMDVSGSMGEREKDLAKRFYMLLHLFLKRRYGKVDIVFIRHTHDAQEVDEQEFFHSRQSGGTIVSTALDKMLEIQKARYATADWNIYAAQASDGYTQSGDARRCVEMLNADVMPLCQYYAYIEILDEREMEVFASEDSGAELWRAYRTVADGWSNFATKRISKPADIFPVFRELFKKGGNGVTNLLFSEAEWDFATLDRTFKAIEDIAHNDLKLDTYPNQIEIISSEQMLDAYSSLAMPLMYNHWSFGKIFAREEAMYRGGHSGLAYEIVINSSPCISYLMEENTMTMQALVIAHAAFGHNHFFKNNYLFRQWTNAEGILDYLAFAKKYIAACEEKYGREEVEATLDSAHALMDQGVFRYRRPPKPSRERALEKVRARQKYEEEAYNELWRTLPAGIEPPATAPIVDSEEEFGGDMKLPEENLLYFLEKHSPSLKAWQRETLRIVRNLAQYFYPQKQTKVMNEGCASFVHHAIMNILYDRGMIDEGSLLEFMHSHTSVVFQPEFDDRRYSGINPYALGFGMMTDIKRICQEPTAEDRDWFPQIAGSGDWIGALKDAWANYRDESFIEQYLSPKLMRDFRLFALFDRADEGAYKVDSIHNETGFRKVRQKLARQYDTGIAEPNIQAKSADLKGSRRLILEHKMHRGVPLHGRTKEYVLAHVERLWGHDVGLSEVNGD